MSTPESDRIELRLALLQGVLTTEFQCPHCRAWSHAGLRFDRDGMLQRPEPGVEAYELACPGIACGFRQVIEVRRSGLLRLI